MRAGASGRGAPASRRVVGGSTPPNDSVTPYRYAHSQGLPSRPYLERLIVKIALERGEVSPTRLARLLSNRRIKRLGLQGKQAIKFRRTLYRKILRICEDFKAKGWLTRALIPYHPALAPNASKNARTTVIYYPTVDLIDGRAFLKLARSGPNRPQLPKRANPKRVSAILLLSQIKMLNETTQELVSDLFEAYLEDTDRRVILLRSVDTGEFLKLPYSHRFRPNRLKAQLAKYDLAWEQAESRGYKQAVFLTLTTDPSKHASLADAYRNIGPAWNRFMSWLAKRLGFRPPYILVFEFTKSGLPHIHVILFGVSRIADKRKITQIWARTGQGRINFLYSLRYSRGRWLKAKNARGSKQGPPKAEGPTFVDAKAYLRKYLSKAFRAFVYFSGPAPERDFWRQEAPVQTDYENWENLVQLALFWASGKRFFTTSVSLRVKLPKRPSLGIWEFVGSFDREQVNEIIRILARSYPKTGPPDLAWPPPDASLRPFERLNLWAP